MPNQRYIVERLSERVYVVGQEPPSAPAPAPTRAHDAYAYLIAGEAAVLAVDAGSGASWPLVRAALDRYGLAHLPIGHVLITHGHTAHVGGLTLFETAGALTVASAAAAGWLESSEDADIIFDGDGPLLIGEFTALALLTPGHTKGCASYLLQVDGLNWLFTGDLLRHDGTVGGRGAEPADRQAARDSLRKLADLSPPPDWLAAGHWYRRDAAALLRRALSQAR